MIPQTKCFACACKKGKFARRVNVLKKLNWCEDRLAAQGLGKFFALCIWNKGIKAGNKKDGS